MPTSISKRSSTQSQSPQCSAVELSDASPETADALDKTTVAELSTAQLSQMTCLQLVRVVRAAQVPLLRPDVDAQLKLYDRQTLERLAYLARRCCRNQGY